MTRKSSGIVDGTTVYVAGVIFLFHVVAPRWRSLLLDRPFRRLAEAHSRIDCLQVGLRASRFTGRRVHARCTHATRHALGQTRVQQRRLRSPLRSAHIRRLNHANFRKLFTFWKRMFVNNIDLFYLCIIACAAATKCPESSKHEVMCNNRYINQCT